MACNDWKKKPGDNHALFETDIWRRREHPLHVVAIIEGARVSSASGRRIKLTSRFPWPMVS